MNFDHVLIIENPALVDHIEDWSKVRSPSRAERRRRQGHRQNIRIVTVPKMMAFSIDGGHTLIMHPAMAQQLRASLPQSSSI